MQIRSFLNMRITSLEEQVFSLLACMLPDMKIAEFVNSVDLDDLDHNEPPHLELHFSLSSL